MKALASSLLSLLFSAALASAQDAIPIDMGEAAVPPPCDDALPPGQRTGCGPQGYEEPSMPEPPPEDGTPQMRDGVASPTEVEEQARRVSQIPRAQRTIGSRPLDDPDNPIHRLRLPASRRGPSRETPPVASRLKKAAKKARELAANFFSTFTQ